VVAAERQARGGVAVLISHQSPIWLATLAAERVGPGRVARLLRPLPPWLVRPLRCPTGSATLLCYHDGALVTACPPWRPPAAQARPGG
jgi:hypothetical protein